MYLVTVQSVITALLGARHRWQIIRRAGVFADPARATASGLTVAPSQQAARH
jgi:hypothetical protein